MFKTEKSILIDAPIAQVFAYASDPARMPEYVPGTDAVKDIQRLPDGGYTYTSVSKLIGMPVEWKCEQTDVIPNEHFMRKGESPVMDFILTFRFEQLGNATTRVIIISENTFHGGALAMLGEAFFASQVERSAQQAIEAAKAHIEATARVRNV